MSTPSLSINHNGHCMSYIAEAAAFTHHWSLLHCIAT